VAGASGEEQASSAEPKPGAHGELVAVEGVGKGARLATGVAGPLLEGPAFAEGPRAAAEQS
jgi:hypothetical protein